MKKNFQKEMLNFQLKSIRIDELNLTTIFIPSNFNNNIFLRIKNWNVIFERIDFCIENNPIINIDKIRILMKFFILFFYIILTNVHKSTKVFCIILK